MCETLLQEQLQWYRLQRHDFFNHFQVIMGYLQLNKPESALSYLREALKRYEAEQRVNQIPEPHVAAILIGWIVQLRDKGITAELDIGEISGDYWEKIWKREYVPEFYGYTKKCLDLVGGEVGGDLGSGGQKRALIRLYPSQQGINCAFVLRDETKVLAEEIWRS